MATSSSKFLSKRTAYDIDSSRKPGIFQLPPTAKKSRTMIKTTPEASTSQTSSTTVTWKVREQIKEELKRELICEMLTEEERKKIRSEVLEEVYKDMEGFRKEAVKAKVIQEIEEGRTILHENLFMKQIELRAAVALEKRNRINEESKKLQHGDRFDFLVQKMYGKVNKEVARLFRVSVKDVATISTELDIPLSKERSQFNKEMKKIQDQLAQAKMEKEAVEESVKEFNHMDQCVINHLVVNNSFRKRDSEIWKKLEEETAKKEKQLRECSIHERKALRQDIKCHTLMTQLREMNRENSELVLRVKQLKEEMEKERVEVPEKVTVTRSEWERKRIEKMKITSVKDTGRALGSKRGLVEENGSMTVPLLEGILLSMKDLFKFVIDEEEMKIPIEKARKLSESLFWTNYVITEVKKVFASTVEDEDEEETMYETLNKICHEIMMVVHMEDVGPTTAERQLMKATEENEDHKIYEARFAVVRAELVATVFKNRIYRSQHQKAMKSVCAEIASAKL